MNLLKFKNGKILEKDTVITFNYDGTQILEFELGKDEYVQCEDVFECDNNLYIVKAIDNRRITAELHFQDLKNKIFLEDRKFSSLQIGNLLRSFTNWSVRNEATISNYRTLEVEAGTTHYEAVKKMAKLYSCTFSFDCLNKIITVVDEPNQINKIYTEDYNIKSFKVVTDSYNFYTRVYGVGKDGLKPNSLGYVDNFQYSREIIPYYFKDERYTVQSELLNKCNELLEECSRPLLEYEIQLADDLNIHDEIIILNEKTQKKEFHRVIEIKKYSNNHHKNVIKLLNKSKTITDYLSDTRTQQLDDLNSTMQTVKTSIEQEREKVQKMMEKLQNQGHVINENGSIYIVDKLPKEQAKKVWRYGLGGISVSKNGMYGRYELAMTLDGEVSADKVIAGTLRGHTIEGATITGGKIKLGQYGHLSPIDKGLHINAPKYANASSGVGFQFRGEKDGNIPKGLFIYNDPDFTTSNEITLSYHDLLHISGTITMAGRYRGSVLKFKPVATLTAKNTPVSGTWLYPVEAMWIDLDHGTKHIAFHDGTSSGSHTHWVQADSSTSDRRLKKDIVETSENASEFIKKMKFYSFKWVDNNHGGTRHPTKIGLIADELQELDKTLVFEVGEDKIKQIDDFRVLNIALKAIQELTHKVETLEDEIKILKEKGE